MSVGTTPSDQYPPTAALDDANSITVSAIQQRWRVATRRNQPIEPPQVDQSIAKFKLAGIRFLLAGSISTPVSTVPSYCGLSHHLRHFA